MASRKKLTLNVQPDVEPVLESIAITLRAMIKAQGFTQIEVQEALGWKGSSLNQFLHRAKTLRLKPLLEILWVIEVDPVAFLIEACQVRALTAGPGVETLLWPGIKHPLDRARAVLEGAVFQLEALDRSLVRILEFLPEGTFEPETDRPADPAADLYGTLICLRQDELQQIVTLLQEATKRSHER